MDSQQMDTALHQLLPVELCLDVGSPYSWFSLVILLRYRERWNLRIRVVPVLLGAIHKATGNSMPSAVPARGAWLQKDIRRNADFCGIPFEGPPASFGPGFNTTVCQRLLTAVALSKGYESVQLIQLSLALYKGIWGVKPTKDLNISDPHFLMQCCLSAGLAKSEAECYLQQTSQLHVKEELKSNTAMAVQRGAFGTPSLFVFKEGATSWNDAPAYMFFGSDRFEQLAHLLGKPWNGPNPSWSKL